MGDYHVHLHPHLPAPHGSPRPGVYPDGHLEAYVEAAAARGVDEVGFTEHLYRCREAADVLGAFWEREPNPVLARQSEDFVRSEQNLSLDRYVEEVVAAKDRGLPVKLGLEVDFFPETIDAVVDLTSGYPFDFLIGSVHWIGGWAVDHHGAIDEYERRGVGQAYEDYFALEAALAGSGAVDVLAHADVVKKFGHRYPGDPSHLYEAVSKEAAATATAVEVSSAGLHKPVGEIYPAPAFLRAFFEAGVPITLASDAHFPSECGQGHVEVVAAARSAGFTEMVRFEGRRPYALPLA